MASSGRSVAPYVLLAPFLVVFGLFTVVPLLQSVVLSTQHTFGPQHTLFVGVENFTDVLSDARFHQAVINTLIFTAGSVFVQLPVALLLAVLLNREDVRGRAWWRLLFFSPQLVGLVFAAIMGAVIFEKQTGLMNVVVSDLAGFFGASGETVAWLLDLGWLEGTRARWTLIIIALWMYAGFNMVYFLAALQNVDRSLEEAAAIDGAGPVARFVNVTVPAIIPVGSFVVLLSIIGSMQLFELPWVLMKGEQIPDQATTVVTYLFQTGFQKYDLGYASAIGWVLALVLMGVALVQRLVIRDGEGV